MVSTSGQPSADSARVVIPLDVLNFLIRVCRPASPKTSTSRSEHPSITAGVWLNPGAQLTIPSTFTIRSIRSRSPSSAATVARNRQGWSCEQLVAPAPASDLYRPSRTRCWLQRSVHAHPRARGRRRQHMRDSCAARRERRRQGDTQLVQARCNHGPEHTPATDGAVPIGQVGTVGSDPLNSANRQSSSRPRRSTPLSR